MESSTPQTISQNSPELMTVREVAFVLGMSESKIYGLCACKKIGHFRIGGSLRIARKQLNDYLQAATQEPAGEE